MTPGFFILGVILCIFAGMSEAAMDALSHRFEESIFSSFNKNYWNPVYSGGNKWKNGDRNQGERFFLSSTLLVGFTEAWHLFKMIRTNCLFFGMGMIMQVAGFWWGVPIAMIAFKGIFTIFYKLFTQKI
jgi:hypothetical protein